MTTPVAGLPISFSNDDAKANICSKARSSITALADLVKDVKVSSSIWMKQDHKFPLFDGWSEGYGAFTYSFKEKVNLINYIRNQKEHHKKINFVDEYKLILEEHGIEFNEKYLL